MNEPLWIRLYRVVFAVLAIIALVGKFSRDDDPWNIYLSKFSYQTNAFVALIFFGGAFLAPRVIGSIRWDQLRGAAVMYMVTLFFVYGFLVSSFDNPFDTTRHWTHTVVHQVIPVAVVLDFILHPFVSRLSWPTTFLWTVYPIAYLAWSLIRGEIDGWYPYDFINPGEVGGWETVGLNVIGVTIGFVALGLFLVWVSHWYHRLATASPPIRPQAASPR